MITLKVDNSECRIGGLSVEQFKVLKDVLSYTTDPAMNYYTKMFSTMRKTMLTKRSEVPTGLIYLVVEWLRLNKIQYVTEDIRVKPKGTQGLFTLHLPYTPYKAQKEAAESALKHQRGIIVAPTGYGKSTIVALIIDKLQVPTLVVVPNLELKRQLANTLKSIFGSTKNILVENIDSPALKSLKNKFDCLIIDEFHHSAAKTYRVLNKKQWSGIYYKFGMTATPFRSQTGEKMLLESVLSNEIYRVNYHDAVASGHIVPMEAYYYELPKVPIKGHTWAQVYNELVVNNKSRNSLISDILSKITENNASVLCLVKEIAHGDNLCVLTGVPFANGQDDAKVSLINSFNHEEIKALIGTTGVLGEGVDTKPAEYIIIAGLGKSKNAFMQQVGRGFRVHGNKVNCKVILFKDVSHKWSLNHFREQCKILLDEFGVRPVKIS